MGKITGSDPPFSSVAIVGLGLIGGSIGLAVRRRWPVVTILGVDRPEVVDEARRRGAITVSCAGVEDLREADLVVLAVPVPEIVSMIGALAHAGVQALVTDVGSTKRQIMQAAAAGPLRFVGGHPIAGSAQAGLANARVDLLEGREWLVVSGQAADADVRTIELVVRGLGAVARRIDADAHDRIMAYVSHLPQVLASALMTTAGRAVGADGLSAAGPGFADMTRLATSPPDIWSGILSSNADFVAEALRAFVAALPASTAALSDPSAIAGLFEQAHAWADRRRRQQ